MKLEADRRTCDRWTNRAVVRVYRATGGRLLGTEHGVPVLLLTTVNRHTGTPCTTPVAFVREIHRFVVADVDDPERGSSWPENLLDEPSARIEIGTQSWEVRAVPARGAERNRLWHRLSAGHPALREPAGESDRCHVFVLEPVS